MRVWTIRLAHQAERDIDAILTWTVRQFGVPQARSYADTLTEALEALLEGPTVMGARRRDDILAGVCILHVARCGRSGRHCIVFRPGEGSTIDVLRVLHDSMDLRRHLGPEAQ